MEIFIGLFEKASIVTGNPNICGFVVQALVPLRQIYLLQKSHIHFIHD
jgi:hypothetical protein